jgi:hypothetical protein
MGLPTVQIDNADAGGEASSPYVVIDVVIFTKTLEQTDFLGASDGCPAVVHSRLSENAFRVGAQGVERYEELAGDFGPFHVGSQQPHHVTFAFAQRLNRRLRADAGYSP